MSSQTVSLAQQLVPIAKIVAVTGSSLLAGLIGSCSYLCVPVIAKAPVKSIAKLWEHVYAIGSSTAPPIAVACSLCFGFLATQSTKLPGRLPNLGVDPTSPFALYTTAALIIPTIVPYTLNIMLPTNNKLHAKAADSSSMSDAETKRLLWKWQGMNYNRSIFVAIGAVLGAIATVSS